MAEKGEDRIADEPPAKRIKPSKLSTTDKIDGDQDGHAEDVARDGHGKAGSQDPSRRESLLVMRLATKEQEIQELLPQIHELKASQLPSVQQLRQALLDPAVNLLFQRLTTELNDTKEKLSQAQDDMSAWKFTPDSVTGRKLMAKCRSLLQENSELGKQLSQGRIAQLEAELALQKKYSQELKSSQDEMQVFILQLDEELEGMQSTIMKLQGQLRQTKQQLADAEEKIQQRAVTTTAVAATAAVAASLPAEDLCKGGDAAAEDMRMNEEEEEDEQEDDASAGQQRDSSDGDEDDDDSDDDGDDDDGDDDDGDDVDDDDAAVPDGRQRASERDDSSDDDDDDDDCGDDVTSSDDSDAATGDGEVDGAMPAAGDGDDMAARDVEERDAGADREDDVLAACQGDEHVTSHDEHDDDDVIASHGGHDDIMAADHSDSDSVSNSDSDPATAASYDGMVTDSRGREAAAAAAAAPADDDDGDLGEEDTSPLIEVYEDFSVPEGSPARTFKDDNNLDGGHMIHVRTECDQQDSSIGSCVPPNPETESPQVDSEQSDVDP